MPKITFWIATRITRPERREYLHLCISSILSQTDDKWEIVISDDNSTLDVWYEKYSTNPKIRLFKQESPLGIFKNFNFCLHNAKGDWFIPMGDDDIVHPSFVADILSVAEKNPAVDVIYFDHENIDANGRVFQITKSTHNEGIIPIVCTWDIDVHKLLWQSPATFFSVVNREKIVNLGWYPDHGMTTDGYIAFIYKTRFTWYYIDKVLAQLRRHKHNASGARSVVAFMDERIHLIKSIERDFWDFLSEKSKGVLQNELRDIEFSHINIIKFFRNTWRIGWVRFFILCTRNGYFGIRSVVILLLGTLLGKNIQPWFNWVSDLYQFFEVRLFKKL
jgi:glycosyltransferase involved in cell wall biosynthesis